MRFRLDYFLMMFPTNQLHLIVTLTNQNIRFMGLPIYIAIDRMPENCCEIQNAACGELGIMLQLRLVKTAEEEATHAEENQEGLIHGCLILKGLIMPWAHTNRIVCADSCFASVSTAQEMKRLGLRFVGVVKTATKKYPMSYLGSVELQQRDDRHALTTVDSDGTRLLAFVWMDRDRRYFISSASSMEPGSDNVRQRWRQIDNTPNAEPERVELRIPQPKGCEIYCNTCGKLDQHNRSRQSTLRLRGSSGQ
uniref:PiggyBac transposable element-derived protein domain-containing protein n=1 Tax=Grammatophora oceanica TaxID=210454 RepID=A0A7S1V4R2_9STRA|mmetsp:Transcript_35120/g.52202  ORF Transcript_35120/g.52202 Transcript_35120/m.52202 type:complete len:251 (+) Transcript_35120:251-1003(+)